MINGQKKKEGGSFDSRSAANADEHEILWFSNLSEPPLRPELLDVKVARENQTSPPDASTANKRLSSSNLQGFLKLVPAPHLLFSTKMEIGQ